MSELIRLAHGISVRAQNDTERTVDVIASTDAIDSYGEVVLQDWDLERYKKNPVVLYGHNAWGKPIGFASEVRVEKGQLLATLHFVDARANPEAEQVWQGIVQGSLRAVSVGFRSKSAKSQEVDGRNIYVLTGNELVEISVVPIPANPEAVAVAQKSFDIIRALAGVTTTPGPAPKENETMILLKTLLTVLCLSANATEDDVVAEATRVKRIVDELEDLTEKKGGETLGAVRAFKQSNDQVKALREKNVELAQTLEKREREDLIKRARANGQIAPASLQWAETCPIDALRGFVETAPAIPQFKAGPVESEKKEGALTYKGKSWSELAPGEKHTLHNENRDLYVAMRDADKDAA